MARDFDSILEDVGSFGRYQKLMVTLVVIPTSLLVALQLSTRMFQMAVPNHWCAVPGRENTSYSIEQWKNITIPSSANGLTYEKCRAYDISWINGSPNVKNTTYECVSWEFDRSVMRETVATSFGWVCDKELQSAHLLSVTSLGIAVGSLTLPFLADKYTGRRPMFLIAIGINLVFNLATVFTPNFIGQMVLRFLSGLSFLCKYQMSYLIAMEFLSPEYRALNGFISFFAWTVGMCITSVMAWVLADWQYILGMVVLADVYMLGIWWYLPESPRWLLSHHKVKDTAQLLLKVSEVNHTSDKVQEESLVKELTLIAEENTDTVSVLSILRYPKFRIRALLLIIFSFVSFFGYGVLLYDIDVFPDRYFMNFFVLSVVEIPGCAAGWICSQYFGRRFTGISSYAVSIALCVFTIIYANNKIVLLILVSTLKFILTMSGYVIDLQVIELFPTTIRSTGVGGKVVFGALSMVTVPYVINDSLGAWFKYMMILISCVICFLSSLPLPETLELPLPQTLPDAERLGSSRPLHKWVHHWNHHKYKPPVPFTESTLRQDQLKETSPLCF